MQDEAIDTVCTVHVLHYFLSSVDCLAEVAGWYDDAEHALHARMLFQLQGNDPKGVVFFTD